MATRLPEFETRRVYKSSIGWHESSIVLEVVLGHELVGSWLVAEGWETTKFAQ